jgi:hypothetical protein
MPTFSQLWVPHLSDSLIVAKVGIRVEAPTAFLQPTKPPRVPHPSRTFRRVGIYKFSQPGFCTCSCWYMFPVEVES